MIEQRQHVPTFRRDDIKGDVLYASDDGRLLVVAGSTGDAGWHAYQRFWFSYEASRLNVDQPSGAFAVPGDIPWVRLEDTPELYGLAFGYLMRAWCAMRRMFIVSPWDLFSETASGTMPREEAARDDWRGR